MRESPSFERIPGVDADCQPGSACVPAADGPDLAASHRPFSPRCPSIIQSVRMFQGSGLLISEFSCSLAVNSAAQERGLGTDLLKDAARRILQAADVAGIWAFAGHAQDERACDFDAHFELIPSPINPLRVYPAGNEHHVAPHATDRFRSSV